MSYYRSASNGNVGRKSNSAAALREQIRNGGSLGSPGPIQGSTSPVLSQRNRPSSAPSVNPNRAQLQRGQGVSRSSPSFTATNKGGSNASTAPTNAFGGSGSGGTGGHTSSLVRRNTSSNEGRRPTSQQMQRSPSSFSGSTSNSNSNNSVMRSSTGNTPSSLGDNQLARAYRSGGGGSSSSSSSSSKARSSVDNSNSSSSSSHGNESTNPMMRSSGENSSNSSSNPVSSSSSSSGHNQRSPGNGGGAAMRPRSSGQVRQQYLAQLGIDQSPSSPSNGNYSNAPSSSAAASQHGGGGQVFEIQPLGVGGLAAKHRVAVANGGGGGGAGSKAAATSTPSSSSGDGTASGSVAGAGSVRGGGGGGGGGGVERNLPGSSALDAASAPVLQSLTGAPPVWWRRAFVKGGDNGGGGGGPNGGAGAGAGKGDKGGGGSKAKAGKRIHFHDQVEVRYVPLHSDYSQRVRAKYWNNAQELWDMAARNSLEFASEGYDFRNVVEEENFTRWGGQLIHPAHVQGHHAASNSFSRTR